MTALATIQPADTLAPCPFCDSAAIITTNDGERAVVRCGFCFAGGPRKHDRAEAVKFWNFRATDTNALLEQMRQLRFEVQCLERRINEDLAKSEKLNALVLAKEAAAAKLNAVCAACVEEVDTRAFARAEEAHKEAHADLCCALEDVVLMPAERLAKAILA